MPCFYCRAGAAVCDAESHYYQADVNWSTGIVTGNKMKASFKLCTVCKALHDGFPGTRFMGDKGFRREVSTLAANRAPKGGESS